MKRIILGDMHGAYEIVENIYNKEHPDMVIMLGDYCDSFNYNPKEICKGYKNLRKLQKKHGKDKFITLLGNHDWHYLRTMERYSGFSTETNTMLNPLLTKDRADGLLPVVYIDNINKTIYSHAGLTKTWMKEWTIPSPEFVNECNENGLDFQMVSFDPYGNNRYHGPLWVRPEALINDFYGDGEWKQIVGHTRTYGKPLLLTKTTDGVSLCNNNPDDALLWVIDTLPFVYLRETLDDDGKLVNREMIQHLEYNKQNDIQ